MLALPGLRNESGEFNCFLNVVVQVGLRDYLLRLACGWGNALRREFDRFLSLVVQIGKSGAPAHYGPRAACGCSSFPWRHGISRRQALR